MSTFEQFQAAVAKVPVALRNNRDRIDLPVRGLQEEAGKIGSLLQKAFASGRLELTAEQKDQLKDRLANILWYTASLCDQTGLAMKDVVAHGATQLEMRAPRLDDQR